MEAIIPKCLPHEDIDIHDIDNQIQSHNFFLHALGFKF